MGKACEPTEGMMHRSQSDIFVLGDTAEGLPHGQTGHHVP